CPPPPPALENRAAVVVCFGPIPAADLGFVRGNTREVVIIGGGLTGLAAAWALEQVGARYRLIELKGRLGGSAGSTRVDGFLLDNGPSLVDRDGDWRFLADLGLSDALTPSDTAPDRLIFRDG